MATMMKVTCRAALPQFHLPWTELNASPSATTMANRVCCETNSMGCITTNRYFTNEFKTQEDVVCKVIT
ncbi:hypothetical protein EK904_010197 [Melospiza melodia maxima]|nr:hypothetical protein EK904_010197 [Melospiza melodia maxima]